MSTTPTTNSSFSPPGELRSQWFVAIALVASFLVAAQPAAAQGRNPRLSLDLSAHLAKAAAGEPVAASIDVIVSGNSEFVDRIAQ